MQPRCRGQSRRSGAALVIVLVVLAVLSMLGAPFAASMLLRRAQSTRAGAVAHLRNLSADLRNRAAAHLLVTHEDTEAREYDRLYPPAERPVPGPASGLRGLGRDGRVSSLSAYEPQEAAGAERGQDVDCLQEITPPGMTIAETRPDGVALAGEGLLSDEQGKVDASTASFALLGNVFGSSHLREAVHVNADRLPLEDASMFPCDGNRETIAGLLVIHDVYSGVFEAVTYTHKAGNELRGVVRGQLLSVPKAHREGDMVMDARALKIFLHRLWGAEPAVFASVTGLRRINQWPLARFFADHLWHHHLSRRDVPRTAVLGRLLGEDDVRVDPRAVAEAEDALRQAGFTGALLGEVVRVMGPGAVIDLAQRVLVEEAGEVLKEVKEELAREDAPEGSSGRGGLEHSAARMERLLDEEGLEALTAADLEKVKDLLTVYGRTEGMWSPESVVEVRGRFGTHVLAGGHAARFMGPGSFVGLSPLGGGAHALHLVCGDRPIASGAYSGRTVGGAVLEFRSGAAVPAGDDRGRVLAAGLQRAPVNINTASFSVITAVLKGVRLDTGSTRGAPAGAGDAAQGHVSRPVTDPQARALAQLIWDRIPVSGASALQAIFMEAQSAGIIDPNQAEALVLNSVNPLSGRLLVSTCAFTYATAETYGLSVLAVARRGEASVRELARLQSFEVFKVAPEGMLQCVWDTQQSFSWGAFLGWEDEALSRWRGGVLPLPGRWGNLVTTYGELAGTQDFTRHFPTHAPAILTAATARLPRHATGGAVESFAGLPEGRFLEGGANLEYNLGGSPGADPPYAVDFYMLPLWQGVGAGEVPLACVTDGSLRRPGSTVTLTYDMGTSELILRVLGGLEPDMMEWGVAPEEAFVGMRHRLPRPLAPDTWYNLGFAVAGPEPGQQVILLDGRPVGQGNLSGFLDGGLAGGAGGGFRLRGSGAGAALPPRGPLWVGDEIVYVGGRTGEGFRIAGMTESDDGETGRGCRGTPILSHQGGALVRPVGYRVRLLPSLIGEDRSDIVRAGARGAGRTDWITSPQYFAIPAEPDRSRGGAGLDLGRGGARLASALSPSTRMFGVMPESAAGTVQTAMSATERRLMSLYAGLGAGIMPQPEPFTYPLLIVLSFYGGREPQEEGRPPGGAAPPPGGSGASSSYYPIERDYLPVPVDPREAGFGESGIIRIRYRFEGQVNPLDPRSRGGSEDYDRICEYSSLANMAVQGDRQYPAFVGLRDISSQRWVYRGEQRITLEEFFQESRPLRQLRVYGISISAGGTVQGNYPPSGVIQIAGRGGAGSVFPQLRDVEWVRYNYIYKNHFLSSVENRIREDRWDSDPLIVPRNWNNTVLRGFCGSVTPSEGTFTETYDPGAIAAHEAGAEILPVYWVASALPGAGDAAVISPLERPEEMERVRIHKKVESDHGVLLSFTQALRRNYTAGEQPVLRRFPEPYLEPTRGGGQLRLIIGPSPFSRSGNLTALVDEVRRSRGNWVWDTYSPWALRAGMGGGLAAAHALPASKANAALRFFALPFTDRYDPGVGLGAMGSARLGGGEFEVLYALGGEMVHLRGGGQAQAGGAEVSVPRTGVWLVPGDGRGTARTAAGDGAGGAVSEVVRPTYYPPSRLREPWPQITIQGTVPAELRGGGYLVVSGFGGPEIWSFESAAGGTLGNVRRGVLGTPVAVPLAATDGRGHLSARVLASSDAEVVRGGLLDTLPQVQELAHNAGVFVPNFPIADGMASATRLEGPRWGDVPASGAYVRIDDGRPESADPIVAFLRNGQLVRDEISGRRIFTGCFGTQSGRHASGTLVYLPFRYYDRYDLGNFTEERQHLTRVLRRPGALWRRVSWEHGRWAEGAALRSGPEPQIHVLARFDGTPGWHDAARLARGETGKARRSTGGLYLLTDPVPREGFVLNVAADQIEVRIMFFWPEGAYGPLGPEVFSDTWKVAPRLRSLVIEYQDAAEVIYHEEFVR